MKFIEEKATKFLSVKLPLLGAFFMLAALVLQWALDYQIVPTEYQAIISTIVLPALAWLGKKIAQPNLQQNPLGFVTVTAGHSNSDPGAVRGSVKEAEFVTKFRNAVELYLRRAGLVVKTDGTGIVNLPLNTAIQIGIGATTKVEFHLNAHDNPKANGVETIAQPKDKALAQNISQAIAGVTGSVLRGEKGWIDQRRSARGKLGFVENGGLVVELGFLSNVQEFAVLEAKYWLVAKAVADVIIEADKKGAYP